MLNLWRTLLIVIFIVVMAMMTCFLSGCDQFTSTVSESGSDFQPSDKEISKPESGRSDTCKHFTRTNPREFNEYSGKFKMFNIDSLLVSRGVCSDTNNVGVTWVSEDKMISGDVVSFFICRADDELFEAYLCASIDNRIIDFSKVISDFNENGKKKIQSKLFYFDCSKFWLMQFEAIKYVESDNFVHGNMRKEQIFIGESGKINREHLGEMSTKCKYDAGYDQIELEW